MFLSICISTFKRGHLIGETIESFLPQLTPEVELVVLDGASPDETEAVVREKAGQHPNIRYVREASNSGIDADFDKVIDHATGQFCWLFSDDDTARHDAVATVVAELRASDPDLLIVDAEVRNKHLAGRFESRRLAFRGRRIYGAAEKDRALAELGDGMSFIGCTIFRRSTWLERDRKSYYGTLFVHVGVAFQRPPLERIVALGKPLVRIRIGNAMWTARGFEIWLVMWPRLIWSFAGYSAAAKQAVVPRHPWRHPKRLLLWRAYGVYGPQEYRTFLAPRATPAERVWMRLIAGLPGALANSLVVGLLAARGQGRGSVAYQLVESSSFSNALSRAIVLPGLGSGET